MQPGSDRPASIRISDGEMIRYRDDRKTVVFTLTNGTQVAGAVRWFDDQAYHILQADRSEVTLLRHAVLFYQAA